MNKIIIIVIIFIISLSPVFAEEFNVYEDNEIFLQYPSNWKFNEVPNSDSRTILFTEPKWTEETGGTLMSYYFITSPESSNYINEKNKEKFTSGFLNGVKTIAEYENVVLLSSEIITINKIDAIRIDFSYSIYSVKVKTTSIIIQGGDRLHTISYISKFEDYDTYYPTFDKTVASIRIKNPHQLSSSGVQKTFRPESFGIIIPIVIGLYFGLKSINK